MVNYINVVSTFQFFYFGVSILFLFNQVSKLSHFFYFVVSSLFLFNKVSKLFNFFYFVVTTQFCCFLKNQFYFCLIKFFQTNQSLLGYLNK